MKKILLAIAIVFMMGLGANAQMDAYISGIDSRDAIGVGPEIPWGPVGYIIVDNTTNSPLGSGILILTALGGGYALHKAKKKK